jgi:hypothetical protein
VLLLIVAAPAATPGTRPSPVSNLAAVYDFYFGGFWAAEMEIAAVFGPDVYQAGADFRTKGIVGFFDDTHLRAETVGRIVAGGLTPQRYRSDEREDDDEQSIEVSFSENGPSTVHAVPEFKNKPWSVEVQDQHGATDPLSAVLIALAPRPANAVCGRHIEAFDGRRRFAFDIAPPEHNGDRILCDGVYIRLAGFKPKTMRERARQPFTIYLTERADGVFQVERLVSETKYGVAVMRLRD